MARINTNVASLIAQQGLQQSQAALNTPRKRLSTGLRSTAERTIPPV